MRSRYRQLKQASRLRPWEIDQDRLQEMLSEMPDAMYKYQGLEDDDSVRRLERMIVGGEVYFASPTGFNDPLDLAIEPPHSRRPTCSSRLTGLPS